MNITDFIHRMPKVELHVHLEGSIQPGTLLKLAKRHGVQLPYDTVEGLRQWYTFTDFNHFVEIYLDITSCVKTVDDIELITSEFLIGQAAQNVRHSEVTYTAWTVNRLHGIPFHEQLAAINRARDWAKRALDTTMLLIIDIPRDIPAEEGSKIASWVIENYGDGIVAFGLGGIEAGHPPQKHQTAFDLIRAAGIPCVLHAGETVGPESIWSAIRVADTKRIGHGVRCVEDPVLVAYLRERQIPLEVCPTSNVCLNVYPSLAEHSLPQLLDEDLYVTINSDDPPMFNTTLTNEYVACAREYGWGVEMIRQLTLNAVRASLLPPDDKSALEQRMAAGFDALTPVH